MKSILTLLLLLQLCLVTAQNGELIYPRGIYNTHRDFAERTPSTESSISATQGRNVVITTYRIKDGDGNKIKGAFAVCDGQNLYVRANKDYLYFEVFFQNKSARTWGIGKVYLTGILYAHSTGKFTFLDTIKDLKVALGEAGTPQGYEDDYRVNGENIGVARKAISRLFRE